MFILIATLLAAALIIYFSCELFVNAIEWLGRKIKISRNAVGTILAAFGTALPESVVTFVAVVFGQTAGQKDIGIGAALGGPLVLSTWAYAIVGLSILIFAQQLRRPGATGNPNDFNSRRLSRDQLWFLGIFLFKAALGFIHFPGKGWLSILFIAAYSYYCYTEMSAAVKEEKEWLEPLKFRPKAPNPETLWVVLQTGVALMLIFLGSQLFVNRLELLSKSCGLAPHIVALFLSPVATELPEILNAVIWVRQGKMGLALGNISGSMMIQATIPTALGLIFTPWLFDDYLAVSALATVLSISYLWLSLRRKKFSAARLVSAVLFYAVFIAGIVLIQILKRSHAF